MNLTWSCSSATKAMFLNDDTVMKNALHHAILVVFWQDRMLLNSLSYWIMLWGPSPLDFVSTRIARYEHWHTTWAPWLRWRCWIWVDVRPLNIHDGWLEWCADAISCFCQDLIGRANNRATTAGKLSTHTSSFNVWRPEQCLEICHLKHKVLLSIIF